MPAIRLTPSTMLPPIRPAPKADAAARFSLALALRACRGALFAALAAGCATPPPKLSVYRDTGMADCLTACDLTGVSRSDVASQVGNPTSKEVFEDGVEVWTYRFNEQGVTQTHGTATPFFGSTLVDTEQYTPQYDGFVALTFTSNLLTYWSLNGHFRSMGTTSFARLDPYHSRPMPKGGVRICGYVTEPNRRFYVTYVASNSTAAAAGLQPADCILSIDGRGKFSGHYTMVALLAGEPGTKMNMAVYRPGKKQSWTVEVEREPMAPNELAACDLTGKW